jgi:cytochrome c-type biogenesis protein CcmF
MAFLGSCLLLTAFVSCAYAASICIAGAWRRSRRLIESGLGAFHLTSALMFVASGAMTYAFVAGDFRIKYVQHYSDSVQPLFYKITSYWGGLDGSIMFWVFMLSLFGSAAVHVNRERHRELIPYVAAIIAIVEMFFLFLMVIHNNPFDTFLTTAPVEGRGLNPLLQNFYMAIHPPTMYLGFVGLTIPYAFGMAALITGYLDDSWLVAVRRWTMVAWLFLSFGLCLGMIWAYEELGWGGYWGWDPVENAALLPWFTATAFLHSVMVQEKRGMLRVWNMSLVIITFFLTIFGTFMTRSGVVQSVHAFGEDIALARMFAGFMSAILTVSFGFVIYRLPLLRSRNELDSWTSREAAFLVNNWILLFAALFVLFATMFPTLSEAVTGERLTVGPPFFNRWMLPIGLALLFLTGYGPLTAWRKSTLIHLRDSFMLPVGCGSIAGVTALALGVRVWASGICFAFSGFVLATIAQEFWRGARVRQQATGTDVLTAAIGLVGRNKRRYGGYVIHVGVVLIFLGFAGGGFKQDEQVSLKPGQQARVGSFTVRLNSVKVTDDGQKQMVTADTTVMRDGEELARMYPARWYYRKHEEEPTSEVAIRRGIAEDIYLVLAAFSVDEQSAGMSIVVNPLVNWVWTGFGVLGVGTALALLPETVFVFASAAVPAGAAPAAMLLLAALLFPASATAQDQIVPLEQRSALHRRLETEIMCTCGCRRPVGDCGMLNCPGHASQMSRIKQLLAEGNDHDQVISAFVSEFGGEDVLAAPIDRGFNRLAWLFPCAVAAAGLVAVLASIKRWSSASVAAAAGAQAAALDPAILDRLNDELRTLD